MFQKRLKKELNKIEVPAYDTHKYKETIAKAKKIKLHPENLRMSSTEFFCNQLRFIKTETWILKIIVSAFFVFYFCAADIPKVYRYSCYYWLPVSLVILVFALQRGYISRLLSNRILVIGGEISYSFYLIHLFIILTYLQMATLYQWHIHWMISVPVIFCITIALSLLSYYYFEKPANKWVKRILTKKQS